MSDDHVKKKDFKRWLAIPQTHESMYNNFHEWAKAVSDVIRILEEKAEIPPDQRLWKPVDDPKEPPPPPPDLK